MDRMLASSPSPGPVVPPEPVAEKPPAAAPGSLEEAADLFKTVFKGEILE